MILKIKQTKYLLCKLYKNFIYKYIYINLPNKKNNKYSHIYFSIFSFVILQWIIYNCHIIICNFYNILIIIIYWNFLF